MLSISRGEGLVLTLVAVDGPGPSSSGPLPTAAGAASCGEGLVLTPAALDGPRPSSSRPLPTAAGAHPFRGGSSRPWPTAFPLGHFGSGLLGLTQQQRGVPHRRWSRTLNPGLLELA